MQLSPLLPLLTPTLASIAIRSQVQGATLFNIGWIEGDDQCTCSWHISRGDENPCEKPFTATNGKKYVLKKCGTDEFALYNEDGTYNHACGGAGNKRLGCGGTGDVTKNWVC